MALFCRELGRWNYGAFDRGGRLVYVATIGLVSWPRRSWLLGNHVVAALVEWVAVHILKRWEYT
ncbi:MAG TPA: hypothetical protein VGK57_17245, partial [Candidatus Binatia bacterium]